MGIPLTCLRHRSENRELPESRANCLLPLSVPYRSSSFVHVWELFFRCHRVCVYDSRTRVNPIIVTVS